MPGTGTLGRKITMTMGGAAVAGVKTKDLAIANEPVDVTDDNSDGFRELLAEPGSKTLDLSVSGVTKSLELLRAASENVSQVYAFVFTYEDGSSLAFNGFMTSFSLNATDNEGSQFDAAFQNTDQWTFTPGV